ncbi:hypothetical protein ILUMI_25626 [Ignelater luminosus]|uniref:Timeless C-terminal domain-containing protein n=1 Tax=Ignelater luminosus TaxID=2038154 RepID=A0A8K0FZH1_IGNLU|nr:hypothetical protein ILUMI_25626 [Ignelater luminosus]
MNMSETSYKFSDFTKRLCHQRVVRACGLALRNFEQNSVQTNHCIVKLLHRIAWDWKMHGMIFQVSIFKTFQKIYERKSMPQYKELVRFATYILGRFFELTKTHPKIYMEALFWKSTREANDIEEGYESYRDDGTKGKKSKNSWTHLEEEELSHLFQEFKDMEYEGNIVNWITNSLINNTRTKKAVSQKLKEMGLLNDEIPRVSKIRPPREWGEDEEVQLRELYELCKDEMDPLGCIEARLNIRRPKKKIVGKLLEMGLIQDKKEVRKKRTRKSQGSKVQDEFPDDGLTTDESEAEATDSSGSGSDDDVPQNRPVPKRPTKNTQRIKKSKNKYMKTSTEGLIKLLKTVSDMTEALEWLKESFSDVADDFEENPDDTEEGVPLVAIFEYSINAMENENFVRLLHGFGVKEPADEQETHWRIPSNLTVDTLRHYCQLLTDTIENKLPETSNSETNVQLEEQGNSSDEDIFDKLRRITKNSNNNLDLVPSQQLQDGDYSSSPSSIINFTSTTQDAKEKVSKRSKNSKNSATQRKKKIAVINRDGESGSSNNPTFVEGNDLSGNIQTSSEITDNVSSSEVIKTVVKPKRKIIAPEESDDEDEDYRNFRESSEDNVNMISKSQKAKRKRNVLDSESEDDTSEKENTSQSEQNKDSSEMRLPRMKRNRIASDDEDM